MTRAPAYQTWHCGECDAELEESQQGWICRADGAEFDYRGQPIESDTDTANE